MDRFTQLVLLMLLGPLSVACYVVQNDLYRSDKWNFTIILLGTH